MSEASADLDPHQTPLRTDSASQGPSDEESPELSGRQQHKSPFSMGSFRGQGERRPSQGSFTGIDRRFSRGSMGGRSTSANGTGASPAAGSAAMRALISELESSRRAWREEGSGLRDKVLDINRRKLDAEQRVTELEAEIAKLQRALEAMRGDASALREQVSDARQSAVQQAERDRDRIASLERQLQQAQQKDTEKEEQTRAKEQENEKLRGDVLKEQEAARVQGRENERLRAEATEQQEAAARLTARVKDLESRLASAQSEGRMQATEHEAELASERDAHERDVAALERRLSTMEAERDQAGTRWHRREEEWGTQRTKLDAELRAALRRAAEAEADRDMARGEVEHLRRLLATAESEFAAVSRAVHGMAGDY